MSTTLGSADAQILTTGTDVLTPGADTWFVTKATVNNQDSVARTVTAYRVPAGGTAGPTNIIVAPMSIPAGETDALPLSGQPFGNNQVLHVSTSATAVMNINVGYFVVTG